MLGPYPARHASANFVQSTSRRLSLPSCCPSAMTDDRQSTTVPNVSNTSALTDASCGFAARWPPARVAITAHDAVAMNARRETSAWCVITHDPRLLIREAVGDRL